MLSFFFGYSPLFRLSNIKLTTLFSLSLCVSISHELHWHVLPDVQGLSHGSSEHYDTHKHHAHELSSFSADQRHNADGGCDFFHGDLSEILDISDAFVSLIKETEETASKTSFSRYSEIYTYRARAPPVA